MKSKTQMKANEEFLQQLGELQKDSEMQYNESVDYYQKNGCLKFDNRQFFIKRDLDENSNIREKVVPGDFYWDPVTMEIAGCVEIQQIVKQGTSPTYPYAQSYTSTSTTGVTTQTYSRTIIVPVWKEISETFIDEKHKRYFEAVLKHSLDFFGDLPGMPGRLDNSGEGLLGWINNNSQNPVTYAPITLKEVEKIMKDLMV